MLVPVADSVNRGISMAKRMRTAYTIRFSINKDLKLKKRKGKGETGSNARSYIQLPGHVRVM